MNPKVAVVGCGYWGKNLVRNFRELNALSAICDVSEYGKRMAREIAPDVELVTDYAKILNSDVDAVVIATPAVSHFTLVKQAIEAGKDVFTEKPLAISYEHGSELVELAEAHERILMVGHVLEYHPAVRKLLTLVNDDTLGKIQYIYSNRLSLGKVRREENILWSFAPHDIAVILRVMGQLPLQVVACGGGYVQPNIADVTVTNLLFDNGVRAHIYVSWLHPFKEQRLVIVGSRRMATFDDVSKKLLLFDQWVEVNKGEPVPIRGEGEEVDFDSIEPLRKECQAFLRSLETRKAPLTDGRSGLDVLRVLQAAQRSLVMNGQQETLSEEQASVPQVKVVNQGMESLVTSKKNRNGSDSSGDVIHL